MNPQPITDNPHDQDHQSNLERRSHSRTRYLEEKSYFDAINCRIIALAESDLEPSKIAAEININDSAVNSRINDLDDLDPALLTPRYADELSVRSPVGIEGTKLGGAE